MNTVYIERAGTMYPVRCDMCDHYRQGAHEWMNAATIDPALSSCKQRSGRAMTDVWRFADHAVDPCETKPDDCDSFRLYSVG